MSTDVINSLTNDFCYPLLQSYVTPKNPITCAALFALGALGSYILYRSWPPTPSTNLRSYVVLTPNYEDSGSKLMQAKRRRLYKAAKRIIESLPKDFTSNVDFNDRKLEIGFNYGADVLYPLGKNYPKLWPIFSQRHFDGSIHIETKFGIFSGQPNQFCIKNFREAYLQLTQECKEYKEEAENFIKNALPIKIIPNFADQQFDNYPNLLSAIFKKSKGLSIGEYHSEIASKYFLVSQMSTLARLKVETLFMEGVCEGIQGDLDAYFDPQTDVEDIPLSIQYYVGTTIWAKDVKKQCGYTKIDVIKAAKRAGIKRIVGIEPLPDFFVRDRFLVRDRDLTLNYHAKLVIEREMPREGNYVIYSGHAHAVENSSSDIPPFPKLLGIPSIAVLDGPNSIIKTSDTEFDESFHPTIAVFISKDKSQKKMP